LAAKLERTMPVNVEAKNREVKRRARAASARTRGIDLALGARANLFVQPGGDTELAIHIRSSMARRGMTVDYRQALSAKVDFGLSHLLNMELPLAIDAIAAGRPYVVTSLYEDLARFRVASMATVSLFQRYVADSDRSALERGLETLRRSPVAMEPSNTFRFVAEQASAVLVTGAAEADAIRRDFGNAPCVEEVPIAFEQPADLGETRGESFEGAFGVKDYLLCVGRLETRKNQLMLLYALEDDERPIVFVNSTTVEPEYEGLCKQIRRRGPTIFTGRVSRGLLNAAYREAAAHALPSWYELPGLVTLEAAWRGCPVVAPDWGTLRSYLGDGVDYCEPHDPASIRQAVQSALERPRDGQLRERVERFRWDATAERLHPIYRKVRERFRSAEGKREADRRTDAARAELELFHAKEHAMKAVDSAPADALALTSEILRQKRDDAVVHFIRGLAALRSGRIELAVQHLSESVARAPLYDGKTYLYLYLALSQLGRHDDALLVLEDAERLFPFRRPETDRMITEYRHRTLRRCGSRRVSESRVVQAAAGSIP
jgi:glycosyltransferase involved in cell wall biosynthesis